MNKYMVYIEDSKSVYKLAIPAESVESACDYVQGNGEVIAVKDVTDEYPISESKVRFALENGGFGTTEIDFIARALERMNIAF